MDPSEEQKARHKEESMRSIMAAANRATEGLIRVLEEGHMTDIRPNFRQNQDGTVHASTSGEAPVIANRPTHAHHPTTNNPPQPAQHQAFPENRQNSTPVQQQTVRISSPIGGGCIGGGCPIGGDIQNPNGPDDAQSDDGDDIIFIRELPGSIRADTNTANTRKTNIAADTKILDQHPIANNIIQANPLASLGQTNPIGNIGKMIDQHFTPEHPVESTSSSPLPTSVVNLGQANPIAGGQANPIADIGKMIDQHFTTEHPVPVESTSSSTLPTPTIPDDQPPALFSELPQYPVPGPSTSSSSSNASITRQIRTDQQHSTRDYWKSCWAIASAIPLDDQQQQILLPESPHPLSAPPSNLSMAPSTPASAGSEQVRKASDPAIQSLIQTYANWSIDNPHKRGGFQRLYEAVISNLDQGESISKKAVMNRVCQVKKLLLQQREAQQQEQPQQINLDMLPNAVHQQASASDQMLTPIRQEQEVQQQQPQLQPRRINLVMLPVHQQASATNQMLTPMQQQREQEAQQQQPQLQPRRINLDMLPVHQQASANTRMLPVRQQQEQEAQQLQPRRINLVMLPVHQQATANDQMLTPMQQQREQEAQQLQPRRINLVMPPVHQQASANNQILAPMPFLPAENALIRHDHTYERFPPNPFGGQLDGPYHGGEQSNEHDTGGGQAPMITHLVERFDGKSAEAASTGGEDAREEVGYEEVDGGFGGRPNSTFEAGQQQLEESDGTLEESQEQQAESDAPTPMEEAQNNAGMSMEEQQEEIDGGTPVEAHLTTPDPIFDRTIPTTSERRNMEKTATVPTAGLTDSMTGKKPGKKNSIRKNEWKKTEKKTSSGKNKGKKPEEESSSGKNEGKKPEEKTSSEKNEGKKAEEKSSSGTHERKKSEEKSLASHIAGLQLARRSKPFHRPNPANPGWCRKYNKVPPSMPKIDALPPINMEFVQVLKTNLLNISMNEWQLDIEDQENEEDGERIRRMKVKMEPRSEFDDLARNKEAEGEDMPFHVGDLKSTIGTENAKEEEEEEPLVMRPPPVFSHIRLPKVRVMVEDCMEKCRKKKKRGRKRKTAVEGLNAAETPSSSQDTTSNTPQNLKRQKTSTTPGAAPPSSTSSRLTRRNAEAISLDAFQGILPHHVVERLLFNGSHQCKLCNPHTEWSRSAYPLHMLAQHDIFIDWSTNVIDHLRELCRESFQAIIWRCEYCTQDFHLIDDYIAHCDTEEHRRMAPKWSNRRRYTIRDIKAIGEGLERETAAKHVIASDN